MSVQQTPGLIDAHSHLRGSSLASQGVVGCANLEEALLRFTAMTDVYAKDDAFVACAELVAAGVTGVQVMFHAFAEKDDYLARLDLVAAGIEKSGIRALVILGVTDQLEFLPTGATKSVLPPWLPAKQNLLASDLEEVLLAARKAHPTIEFGIGPVGAQWCSDQTLAVLGELAQQGMRIHSHLLESPRQRRWSGDDPLERLEQFGLLGPKTSLAHGVWCEKDDLKRIADAGAQLVTCPGSNQALSAGKAKIDLWKQAGVQFGFGLDSAADPVLPLQIGAAHLDPLDAFNALTRGGVASTDLPGDQDRVIWRDMDLGVTESVTIGGNQLVKNSRLAYHEDYLSAKERMLDTLQRDSSARGARHRMLTELLPEYQEVLDQCLK